jgi:hypothetical protein
LHPFDPLQNLSLDVGQILCNDLYVCIFRYYIIRLHQVPTWQNTTRLINPSHPTLWFILTGWFGSVFPCLIEDSRNFGWLGFLYSSREARSSDSVSQGSSNEVDVLRLALCTGQSQAITILHRAEIINEFHKGAQTSNTLRTFRNISTTGGYYYNHYKSSK